MPKPARVLLAEADSISTQLLSFSLEREGFEVVKARGGLDALRLAREQQVDIVVSEVLLENIDGLELCRRLRSGWNTQRIPILLVTSLGSSEERIAGLTAGADDYLVKPYDVRELMIRLNHLVDTYSNCYQVNPLTKLPGSQVIQAYVDKTCQGSNPWALLQIDINHFGAYNKIFGYDEGDTVLKSVADLLRLAVLRDDREPVFLGHEGRDDFTVIVRPERVDEVCNGILSRFEKQSANFYPAEHREASHQIWIDRQGNARVEQPIGLSIGVVTDRLCDSLSYLELKEAAESVLNRAKMERQSGVFTNRRHLVGKLAQMRRGNQSSQRPA